MWIWKSGEFPFALVKREGSVCSGFAIHFWILNGLKHAVLSHYTKLRFRQYSGVSEGTCAKTSMCSGCARESLIPGYAENAGTGAIP